MFVSVPEVVNRGWPAVGPGARCLAALIVVAFVAAGCSGASSEPTPSEASSASAVEDSSVAVIGELGEAVDQDCSAHLSGTGLRCVLVAVPIDRADRAAGNTAVSVVIRPGTGDGSLPPLAVLQGGPGGASSDLAPFLPSRPYEQVLIDQRGVGFGSAGFWCHELLNSLTLILEATRDEADVIASDALTECSDRLKRDPVFAHTSTKAHAADVIDVMAALGYKRWLLYGVSYGTTIALEVLRNAPAGLAGAVLDGVYPGHLDLDADVAAGAERVIRELDEECSVDPACSALLGGSTGGEAPSMAGLLAELIPRFNSEPMVVALAAEETTMQEPLDVLIDGDSVAGVVFQMLYDEFSATLIPGLLAGLAQSEDAATADVDGLGTATRLVALVGVEVSSQQAHGGARRRTRP